jgi:hypothetical protein
MFGRYRGTFRRECGDILVEAESVEGLLTYRRRCEGKTFERILVTDTGEVIINPVEPVNLPEEVTNYLQIEFSPMMIEPGASRTVYLKFPVEIGVLVESAKDIKVLDVFALGTQKYTLYGSPTTGVIARWYQSEVYPEIPQVEPFREGVMEFSIHNASHEWAEVSTAVFKGVDMKIYYDEFVAASAMMKILGQGLAETDFIDAPLRPGMAKSIELYTARKIPVIGRGCLMECGF